jgi:3-dehydroquinate synthase
MGMKVDLSDIDGDLPDADGLLALLAQEKKVQDGKLAFIMARSIGDSFVTCDVDLAVVKSVLEDALKAR